MSRSTCSIVVPCYNEEATLRQSVSGLVAAFEDEPNTELEVLIVDDCSTDESVSIAGDLSEVYPTVKLLRHAHNRGNGAALRTGFEASSGDFVGVHDADLEYDPRDLLRLLVPLRDGHADVVFGSRFLTASAHRVLYFWHSVGNRLLTFLSNMFTDLNLTDMETCYKLFRRDVWTRIVLHEDRFGVEPEVTAKVAELRVRVFEIGISYYGRTYEEGKKIRLRDGVHALYCILRYNGHRAPAGMQFLVYALIGGTAALVNLLVFMLARGLDVSVPVSAGIAFVLAAALNYLLCIWILFKHMARWSRGGEQVVYWMLVALVGAVDIVITSLFISSGTHEILAKAGSSVIGLVLNFAGRKWAVFPEPGRGPWRAQGGNE